MRRLKNIEDYNVLDPYIILYRNGLYLPIQLKLDDWVARDYLNLYQREGNVEFKDTTHFLTEKALLERVLLFKGVVLVMDNTATVHIFLGTLALLLNPQNDVLIKDADFLLKALDKADVDIRELTQYR